MVCGDVCAGGACCLCVEGADAPVSCQGQLVHGEGREGQGLGRGGIVPSIYAPNERCYSLYRQPVVHWSPFQPIAVLSLPPQDPSPRVFPTLKLLPVS